MHDEIDLVERVHRGGERLGLRRVGDGITRSDCCGRGAQGLFTPGGQDDGERARKLSARHIADTQTYFSAVDPEQRIVALSPQALARRKH